MKGRNITFVLGALAASLLWGVLWLCSVQPRDYSKDWPAEISRMHSENTPWYRAATKVKAGGYMLCAPWWEGDASGALKPTEAQYPHVLMNDYDRDGLVNSMVMVGGTGVSICVEMGTNGAFTGYSVCLGPMNDTGSVAWIDSDCDGQFNVRMGPGQSMAVFLGSNWYERIVSNRTGYVEMNGQLTEIVCSNGQWRIR